ncbi:DUF2752 domain-containing protein [Pedobacter mendelii]|uniref:DUF2752 domain-containing protein n=1 Tax=Pedobacter mendelii TaxID=1908240 RepID=UPI00353057A7
MLSIIFLQNFCSSIFLFDWLQNNLIPCPFKALMGFDCPGCGFQRAFIFLIEGDLKQSWNMYPPTVPLIFLFLFAGFSYLVPFKNRSVSIQILAIIIGNFILFSYLYKLFIK